MPTLLKSILAFAACVFAVLPTHAQPADRQPPQATSPAKDAGNSSIVTRLMAFDKNGDGKLTKEEVTDSRLHRRYLAALGHDILERDVAERCEAPTVRARDQIVVAAAGGGGRHGERLGGFGHVVPPSVPGTLPRRFRRCFWDPLNFIRFIINNRLPR